MTRPTLTVALSLALTLLPASVLGQVVNVRVQSAETLEPLAGAIVTLIDSTDTRLRSTLSNQDGRTFFSRVADGTYRLRVEMIGRATAVTEPFLVSGDRTARQLVRLAYRAIPLQGVEVSVGPRPCRAHPLLFNVWDDVRKALTAAVITEQEGTYRFTSLTYLRELDEGRELVSEEQTQVETATRAPYVSVSSTDLVGNGFVRQERGQWVYYGPDAEALLSDAFLNTHCFRVLGANSSGMEVLGLGFEPLDRDDGVADISGALWVDRESGALRWLDFEYQGTDPAILSQDAGGFVQFRQMPAGTWIVSDWWIRVPIAERAIRRPQWFLSGFIQRGGRVLEAREIGGPTVGEWSVSTGIHGVAVHEDGTPVRAAQIRATAGGPVFTTVTRDDGSFGLLGLSEGDYEVEAVDPRLVAFGHRQPSVEGQVIEGEMSRIDVRLPSLEEALSERCLSEDGPEPRGNGILAGFVREAGTDEPAGGVVVIALWQRSSSVLGGWETTSNERGAYLMCGIPQNVEVQVYSRLGEVRSTVVTYPGNPESRLRWLNVRRPEIPSR